MNAVLQGTIALFAGACLVLGSEPGRFDKTLPVTGLVELDVRSDPGGLVITAGPSGSVRVRAVIKPLYGRLDLDLAEANIRALERNPPIEQVGSRIRIGYVKDPALLRAVTIHFEIEVPVGTAAHAFTTSGGIRIDGIAGPVEVSTTSGRTEIRNVASSVSVRGQSGGVLLSGIKGRVDVKTTSGGTEISEVSGDVHSTTHSGAILALRLGGSVYAETKSGAIRISQLSAAPIRALTHSGAVRVELAAGSGYLIDAQSGSGKVTGPMASTSRHSLKAQIGSGGPLVDIDTHSSRIDVI